MVHPDSPGLDGRLKQQLEAAVHVPHGTPRGRIRARALVGPVLPCPAGGGRRCRVPAGRHGWRRRGS